MASINKVILVGNLGKDPEVRYMPNGDAVANITIATSESWKDKNTGEKKELTEWHRVVFYRKLAEIVGQYLKKGSAVYVEGSIKTRKWTDKEGVERYTTEINANEMQMLGGKNSGGSGGETDYDQSREGTSATRPTQSSAPAQNSVSKKSADFADLDDDIPF